MSGPELPDDSIGVVVDLFFVTFSTPVSSAYTSLKDGGQMPLIRDAVLRERIVDYYEVQQHYMDQWRSRSEDEHDELTDLIGRHLVPIYSDSAASLNNMEGWEFQTSWLEFARDGDVLGGLLKLGVIAAYYAESAQDALEQNILLRQALVTAL